jgi:hypothetical protein
MIYESQFVILSHATKAIRSPVAAKVIKSMRRQKGRMSLATRNARCSHGKMFTKSF